MLFLNRNHYYLKEGNFMHTWTIIGGGIQALTIALKLIHAGLPTSKLTLIDPHSNLCAQFDERTKRINMPFLRSPCVHHVHPDPFHLKQFAKTYQYMQATLGKYQRPQRDMFIDHVHTLIHRYQLHNQHVIGSVTHIKQHTHPQQQWVLTLNNKRSITTDNLVIAMGSHHDLNVPEIFHQQQNVQHIFDNTALQFHNCNHVVGSGVSAAHLVHKLLHYYQKHVHLWLNKTIAVHDFDADPAWLGPKNMTKLTAFADSAEKLSFIEDERHKGSMPQELYLHLKKYQQQGRLTIHQTPITTIRNKQIHTIDEQYNYDHILLATGFKNSILQQPIIKSLILEHAAPMTNCGYPQLTDTLEWLPQLFVSGGLADLKLGPFARNIAGGREAAKRIAQAFLNQNIISQ